MYTSFNDWTKHRRLVSMGTNAGADVLPFQTWHHFKESFAPEIVARAIDESGITVERCLDPFGGSGTSALASQFLGVHPITIEVNPFLADLIKVKLTNYQPGHLVQDIETVIRYVKKLGDDFGLDRFENLPPTFIEPGLNRRWLFSRVVAVRIFSYLSAIGLLSAISHRRLFRVLLGGCLVKLSNTVVNGKGRRYRKNWENRSLTAADVDVVFKEAVYNAISEINRFNRRACLTYEVVQGDCRKELYGLESVELVVFSPPYPNSFDYTDIYNIELWMLGYLDGTDTNQALRGNTLCSHVQLRRDYPRAPEGSERLSETISKLYAKRTDLWNQWIPEMIGGYFADMLVVLKGVAGVLTSGGSAWVIVGDSRYVGVPIESASILVDLVPQMGLIVESVEPFRSMRTSAQQGGNHELAERMLILRKD